MAAPARAQDEPNSIPGVSVVATGLPINGFINAPGDVDYFTFPAYAGETFGIGTGGFTDTDTIITLFDRFGNQILEDDDGGPGLLSFFQWTIPAAGTYHVRVKLFDGAATDLPYQLFITPRPPDEPNVAPGTPTPSDGTPTVGYIHTSGDADLFSFSATAGEPLSISTLGPTDTIVTLIASDGTTALANNDDGGLGFCSLLNFTPAATGTMFVRVNEFSSGIGPYLLRVGPPVDDLPNTAPGPAFALNRPPVSLFLEKGGDLDWVSVDVVAGETYTFATGGECDTILTLFAADGTTQVAEDDDGGPGLLSLLTWTATFTGTANLRVKSFDTTQTGG
ncbi:MAG TPA: PPC domain-containing protein, partial [Planctomycetota bacterium]|nr:PPC domain-containing protein [Planctomycetota bacterium]